MTTKQYKELAAIMEAKASCWCAIDVTDFLEENFKNFDREKFMIACGWDQAYTYDEMLTAEFDAIENYVNLSVKIVTH